jgi:hypothetical protein
MPPGTWFVVTARKTGPDSYPACLCFTARSQPNLNFNKYWYYGLYAVGRTYKSSEPTCTLWRGIWLDYEVCLRVYWWRSRIPRAVCPDMVNGCDEFATHCARLMFIVLLWCLVISGRQRIVFQSQGSLHRILIFAACFMYAYVFMVLC